MPKVNHLSIDYYAKRFLVDRNILILIIATIGMLPELVQFGGYYIKGDITTQMLPFVYETKRMFASGVPFWSWNTYFGDNFIASYAYYTVFNPFTWINCLFPYKYLGVGFTFVLYLKFLVCGYISQMYLKKIGFDERLSLIGCLLFTFSSWAITNLYYYMFMEPMILFPFLLIFVERFLCKEKHGYSGLAMATFVVVTVNYYFAACNLIAAAVYFFCRIIHIHKDFRNGWSLIAKAAGCVLIGIISASIMLIPVLMQLNASPHQTFNTNFSDITSIAERLFWLIYPKTAEGPSYYLILDSAYRSNAASIAVFGLLPMFLFFTKKGNGWIKWLVSILIVLYITPLNGLFSLFTHWDYSRWAYALTLCIIICTLTYLKDFGLPRFNNAIWYCCIVYGIYYLFVTGSILWIYINNVEMKSVKIMKLTTDAIVVAINALALLFLCRRPLNKGLQYRATIVPISICVAVQFFAFSYLGDKEFKTKDCLLTETEYLKQECIIRDETDFRFRTDFTIPESDRWAHNNFGLISNKPSVATFHSIQNRRMDNWNNLVGFSWGRVFRPIRFVESFDALMSVKESALAPEDISATGIIGIPDSIIGNFYMYESDHYIPMGFAYDQYVLSDSIKAVAKCDSTFDIPMTMLSALVIEKKDESELSPYLKETVIDKKLNLDSIVSERRTITCDSFTGHTRGFDAHISLDSARVVFFSVFDDDGFTAYIDGERTKIYETNLGFSSVIVPAGSHDITFRYFPPGLKLGVVLSLFGWIITAILFLKNL